MVAAGRGTPVPLPETARPVEPAELLDHLPAELRFDTSGTTGRPVSWWRTREQLVAEAVLLSRYLDTTRTDVVLTHAPSHHLYGYLLGRLVPALRGLPVRVLRLDEPLPADCQSPLVAAVPASWWLLERSLDRLRAYRHLTVVHSTARLPGTAERVRERVPRLTLHELHGSTETGLVAVRPGGAPDFVLADDVDFAPATDSEDGREHRLRVRSPRIAAGRGGTVPPEHALDDVVERTGPRAYRLTGRRTRLAKVNGRRVDLDEVETLLRSAVPAAEPVCMLFRHELRGEWYDVLVRGGDERRRAVERACRELLPAAEAPRAVRAPAGPEEQRNAAERRLRTL